MIDYQLATSRRYTCFQAQRRLSAARWFAALVLLPNLATAQSSIPAAETPAQSTELDAKPSLSLHGNHRSDLISNLRGGLKQGSSWLGYTDLKLEIDLERTIALSNTRFYSQFHSELGGKPNAQLVGSYMGINNIEVNTNTAQLSQFWLEKVSADGALSLLGGLYALDSEFYVTESSGIFLQPPLGIGTSIGQTGKNGPPIFPRTSLGLRLKYQLPSQSYAQIALMDGVPGDPDNHHGTHVKLAKGDGTIGIVEIGTLSSGQGATSPHISKLALGYWKYTSPYPDLLNFTQTHLNHGWYVLGEFSLLGTSDASDKKLTGFLRFGTANANLYQVDWSFSAGFNYTGFLAERPNDVLALAMTNSHTSRRYQIAQQAENHESILEMTYKYQYNQHLAIQPVVQFVMNPNMSKSVSNASVVGIRFDLNF
ncbi:carbohydrate porin [Undibacterium fentianense]|uniref:Carbohydrate porin n=1 Tax=Undibacterium fentianense TaxID=2828728 RepID=A0A941E521_9BURK|nr:carbohydrate porin [Undibacterium fentianense]MBR7801192.1 carbohydrate porin [Undibacterium fentianense]